jgi:hypothetical protein
MQNIHVSSSLHSLLRSERGSTAIIVSAALFSLVVAAGVTNDMARQQTLNSKIGSALDAANLAALNAAMEVPCDKTPQDWVQEQGSKYFTANLPSGTLGSSPIAPVFTLSDDGSSVLASADTTMATPFLQIVGTNYVPVASCSQVHIPLNGDLGTSATNTSPHAHGDITTGLFSGAQGNVSIATNGTERLRVDGDGDVSIGGVPILDPQNTTATPSDAALSITSSKATGVLIQNANPNGWSEIKFIDNLNTARLSIGYDNLAGRNAPGSYLNSEDGNPINFSISNSVPVMAVTSTGVGIGTSTPTGTLDVENSSNSATLCVNGSCTNSVGARTWVQEAVGTSRQLNTTYTNNTGHDIEVSVSTYSNPTSSFTKNRCASAIFVQSSLATPSSPAFYVEVGFNFVNNAIGGAACASTATIPNGMSYYADNGTVSGLPVDGPYTDITLYTWAELR